MFVCALWLFLFLPRLTAHRDDFDVSLEPGHVKQDYDSMEEVRGHENETETEKPPEDEHQMREAILDVAYYLRRFKFSGYDPRYLTRGQVPEQNLFVEFPSPPLRNIHWEVKRNCEPSFVECVKYLQEQISLTVLPRRLDSLTITKQNGWSFITDWDLIRAADDECLKLLKEDRKTFDVFSGPLQRFQWLISASYYMCFYTMKETTYLKTFTEDCDNYASCIQWDLGYSNKDVRAENRQPFACAFYSFCPDPCCPLKFLSDWSACTNYTPCSDESFQDKSCSFSRKENANFESLRLNHWNVTCNCNEPGTHWESRSGMCVDVDECVDMESPCNYPSETCWNLPGSYKCVCSPLGYRVNPNNQECEEDPVLQKMFFPPRPVPQNDTITLSAIFSDSVVNFLLKITSYLIKVWEMYEAEVNRTIDSTTENLLFG